MSEERSTYEARKPERRQLDGVQRIGDVIRQIVDERDWPLRNSQPRANGDRRAGAGRGRLGS